MEYDAGKDIVCLVVTCSKDPTRAEIFQEVASSIKEIPKENIIAFDNNSEYSSTLTELEKLTTNLVKSNKNFGFWSAINWTLENYESLVGKKKYIYIVESDAVHVKGHWSVLVESASKLNESIREIKSVRLQEFSVKDRHFYDKDKPMPGSRKWAWTRLSNHWTGKKCYFEHEQENFYRTNLVPQLCSLNCIDFMKDNFENLRKMENFTEMDFQKFYYDRFDETYLYDGGIFNTRKSYESDALKGSWIGNKESSTTGYRATRHDKIELIKKTDIT